MLPVSISRRPLTATLLLAAVTWQAGFCQRSWSDELSAERIFPPAVADGDETLLSVEGKFPSWPLNVWCDREDVSCQVEEESGSLQVTVAEDAPPGIAWLRLYDEESASAPLPLLIEPVAVTVESEPNNQSDQATRGDLPAVLVGRLEKANDVDCFAVSVAAGDTLVADVMGKRVLGSPMDAVLQLVDLAGNVLAQSDDARGIDPQLVYRSEHDAEYMLRLFAFPEVANSTIGFAGAASFVYRIQATTGPLVDHSLPLVAPPEEDVPATLFGWNLPAESTPVIAAATAISPPIVTLQGALGWHARLGNDALSDAALRQASNEGEVSELAELPAVLSGHITRPGQIARSRVSVEPGTKYRVAVHSQASGLKLDSVVTVVDSESGKQLARNDDASRNERDSAADFTAPDDTTSVEVRISDLVGGFGRGHAYSVSIGKIEPAVSLSLAADRYRLAADGELEITVEIQRQNGYGEKLSILAVDLPEGVTCEAVESQAKGDSAKEVKLKLSAEAAAAHQGPIRVVARKADEAGDTSKEKSEEAEPVVCVASFPLQDGFSVREPWLSVSP